MLLADALSDTTGTKTTLASLSLDVLWMIIESNLLSKRDLLALCRVKVFSVVATQVLYRQFEGNVYRFLATVTEKPELALHVKAAVLEDPHQVRRLRILRHWGHLGRSVYCRSVRRLSLPDHVRSCWIESLRKGEGESVMALLLAYLPNLQRLTIREGPATPPSTPDGIRSSPLLWFLGTDQRLKTFPCLQEVTLKAVPISLCDFAFLFRIPTMRKFTSTTWRNVRGNISSSALSLPTL